MNSRRMGEITSKVGAADTHSGTLPWALGRANRSRGVGGQAVVWDGAVGTIGQSGTQRGGALGGG